jgi:hypothetical protein
MYKESNFMVGCDAYYSSSGSQSSDDFWLAMGDRPIIPYWPETQGDIEYWTEVQRERLLEIKIRRGLG